MATLQTRNGRIVTSGQNVATSSECCCDGVCSGAATISVSFSGVTLCTGTLDATPFGFGYVMNNLIATGTINDTFTLNSFLACDGSAAWFVTTDNRLNYDIDSGGGPVNQDDLLIIYAKCVSGVFELWMLGGANSTSLFYATAITDLSSISNLQYCAGTAPDPNDACFPGTLDFTIGQSGSAIVTI